MRKNIKWYFYQKPDKICTEKIKNEIISDKAQN